MASRSVDGSGVTFRVPGVTLLFCDLVGSTALLSELGEEMNDLVRRDLFEALRQPVAAFHGTEVKSQGDGLMVAFRASSQDAVGCAVAMQQAVVRLSSADGCPRLAIRVGISSGEVTSEEGDWFGTPVVEAARLCGLAESGQILITDHTLRGCHAVRTGTPRVIGSLTLKGFPNQVPCSEIVWSPPPVDRDSAPIAPIFDLSGKPAACGIEEHHREAMNVWRDVVSGATRALVVAGPPRTGKSLFIAEFVGVIERDSPHVLSLPTALLASPATTALGEAFRRSVMWGPPAIAACLDEVYGLRSLVPALARRINRDPDDTEVGPTDVIATFASALRHLSGERPVVFVIDDLQVATSELNETLRRLIADVNGSPVLFVLSCRDGREAPAAALAQVQQSVDFVGGSRIELASLSEHSVGLVVASILKDTSSTPSLAQTIFRLVGGVAGDVVDAAIRLRSAENLVDDDVMVRRRISMSVPYKGLLALDADDAELFFGRDQLVTQVLERLTAHNFVALVGASGSGKSSVLRAGVVNCARAQGRSVVVVTPTDRDFIRAAIAGAIPPCSVIIDQFEEFFTLWEDTERAVILEGLFSSLQYGPVEAMAIGIRSDFFGHCAEHPCIVSRLADSTVLVGSLNEDELRAMIEGPAEVGELTLDAGFAAMIVADLAEERHPLPLLAHTLFETWRLRASAGRLTVDDYHDVGGVRGSIARTAERVFALELDEAHQRCAVELVLRLVEPGDEHRPPTRRPVPRGVVIQTFGRIGDEVLDVFVRARLFVADDDLIELAHEAILSEWPRLADWIAQDRENLITAAHLTRSADEWANKNRPPADLYRGARLDAARDLVATGRPLTPIEREFVNAGVELRDLERHQLHRTNRRLRRQLTGASIAALLAIVATVIAVAQQRTANGQRHRLELSLVATTATELANTHVDLAALLAVEANRLQPNAASLGALETVLRTQPAIIRTLYPTFMLARPRLVATSENSKVAAFLSGDALTIVDTETLSTKALIVSSGSQAVVLSPNGDQVAVSTDGHITVRSTADGAVSSTIVLGDHESVPAGRMSWIDDSHLFITPLGGQSRTVDQRTGAVGRVWDYYPTGYAVANASVGVFVDFPTAIFAGASTSLTEHSNDADAVKTISNLDVGRVVLSSETDVVNASYSKDGRWLAIGTSQGAVLLRRNSAALEAVALPTQPPVATTAVVSPDGRSLVTFAATGQVVIYDITETESATERLHINVGGSSSGFFSQDSNSLFMVAGDRLLEVALDNREPLATAPLGEPGDVPLLTRADGRKVVVTGQTRIGAYEPHADEPLSGTVSYNQYPLGYRDDDATVIAIDLRDNSILLEDDQGSIKLRSKWTLGVDELFVWNRGGTVWASADSTGGILHLYDLRTLEPIETVVSFVRGGNSSASAITDDGNVIARSFSTPDSETQTIQILDILSGQPALPPVTLPAVGGTITSLTFTPDARHLSYGDDAGHVGDIDLSNGHVDPQAFEGATGATQWLGYTADGDRLLGVFGSTAALWWDTASHAVVGDPITGTASPYDVIGSDLFFAWATSDVANQYLAVSVADGVRQWNFDVETWPEIACERAGRNLTREEWDQYLPADDAYHVTCPQFAAGT
jgi:class 3 adenylate cyclase